MAAIILGWLPRRKDFGHSKLLGFGSYLHGTSSSGNTNGVSTGSRKGNVNSDDVTMLTAASLCNHITPSRSPWMSQGLYFCLKTYYYVWVGASFLIQTPIGIAIAAKLAVLCSAWEPALTAGAKSNSTLLYKQLYLTQLDGYWCLYIAVIQFTNDTGSNLAAIRAGGISINSITVARPEHGWWTQRLLLLI